MSVTVDGGAADATYTVAATLLKGQWKAMLKPAAAGGSYTITAKCTGCKNATAAVMTDVTFGDVWYCGGQSNMALPMVHTLTRNITRDAILAGNYSTLRLHGIKGNMNPFQPWATVKQALEDGWKTPGVAEVAGGPGCTVGATDGTACDSDHSAL